MNSTLSELGVEKGMLSQADLARIDKEGENAGAELLESRHIRHPKEEGVDRLADLVNKGEIFDLFYTHPKLLAGVAQVLGALFQLSALNYRSVKPGMGLQQLHVDWHEAIQKKLQSL